MQTITNQIISDLTTNYKLRRRHGLVVAGPRFAADWRELDTAFLLLQLLQDPPPSCLQTRSLTFLPPTRSRRNMRHATTSEEYSSNSREIEISVLCCARKNEKSNYNFINCSKNRRRLAYYIFQILWSSLIKKNGSKRDETVEKGVTYHWWSFELPLLRRLKLSW